MGVSLTGFCDHIRDRKINKNSNDLANKDVYNIYYRFLIIQIHNYILYRVAANAYQVYLKTSLM